MTEGTPVYFIEDDLEEESVEKGASLLASSVSGSGLGILFSVGGHPETGLATGIGIGSLSLCFLFSMDSGRRAINDAGSGRNIRAFLRAIESTAEGALSLAIPAAAMGLHAGGIEWAIKMAILGGVSGGVLAFALLRPSLSQAFRERNQTSISPA